MNTSNDKIENDKRTRCWFCGSLMFWNGDFNFEDYGIEGEGVVATLTCAGCEGTAEFYTKIEE